MTHANDGLLQFIVSVNLLQLAWALSVYKKRGGEGLVMTTILQLTGELQLPSKLFLQRSKFLISLFILAGFFLKKKKRKRNATGLLDLVRWTTGVKTRDHSLSPIKQSNFLPPLRIRIK